MKFLLLGGPKFLGRALIEAALARGHEVTMFNRGQTNPGLFPEVERLHGDRDGNLDALRGRSWDAVLDTCGYVPRIVHDSAELLADAVDVYAFVSSIAYYAEFREPPVEEDRPAELGDLPDDVLLEDYSNYGALKALCEQAVTAAFADRALLVRPGLIVGPYDPTDRFTYWPRRAQRGGPMLAPAPPDQPVQVIDVRDLAEWMVRIVEERRVGAYNATSPPGAHDFGSMLEACGARDIVWVNEDLLIEHEVKPWTELPCWIPARDEVRRCFRLVDVSRATATGLTFRPLTETARDVPEWTGAGGLQPQREAMLLEAWRRAA